MRGSAANALRHCWALLLIFLCGGLSAVAQTPEHAAAQAPRRETRSTWNTVVRAAHSADGLTFTGVGPLFVAHAAAPDLAVLRSGELVALLDYASDPGSTTIAAARSTDGGRSWSELKPIRLEYGPREQVSGRHGDLLIMPDGTLRLYFIDPGFGSKGAGSSGRTALIRSAVSRDGWKYRLDDHARVLVRIEGRGGRGKDIHPTAFLAGSEVHLVGQCLETSGRGLAQHLYSRDGRRFSRARSLRAPESGMSFVGSIVRAGDGFRAYVSGDRGIRSLVSKDARDWTAEEGLRVAGGWDPAVVELKDGSFLMLYCAEREEQAAGMLPIVGVSPELQVPWNPADGSLFAYGASGNTAADVGSEAEVAAGDALNDDGSTGETASHGPTDALSEEAESGVRETASGVYPYVDDDGYVSLPDFWEKVDYFQWFCGELLADPADNAYFAYNAFMPGPWQDPASKPGWPTTINDMFNGGQYDGPPAPWDPLQHPEWEATHQSIQGLLAQFREATRHEGYAMPIDEDYRARVAGPDGDVALLNMVLPQLSSHRTMVKALLADAWRTDDGRVSSARMLDAWETALRGAEHLSQGPTLIEELVSMAERSFVNQNARRALKEGVFSGDELEAALDTLTEYDLGNRDPLTAIRGEHAFTLDTIQYLYWPKEPGGEPTFREDRARGVFDFSDEFLARLSQVSADDLRATVDAADRYYRDLGRQMSVGYPAVRAADISATLEAYVKSDPIADLIMPNLGRVHQLRARAEASRRATQLAYATHLFKEQKGRWPQALNELSGDHGYEMTVDPFTGAPFGYRVDADGCTIYTRGENGVDDGGRHSPRWDDNTEASGGSDDYVFWPPQSP